HARTTTTDGIMSDSEAEEVLRPEQTSKADADAEADPQASLESLKRNTLNRNLDSISKVQQYLVDGETETAKFRNQVLKLTQNYYIKSSRLSEAEIVELREQKAVAVVEADGLMERLCQLAYEAFEAERKTHFTHPDGAIKKEPLNLMSYVMTLCQNYSDQSEQFALALSKNQWVLKLCSEMQRDWADDHLADKLPDLVNKRLRQSLSVVYNMLFKGNSEIFFNLVDYHFVDTAQPYLKSGSDRFRFSAYLVLVFSCNEEEASRLLINEKSLVTFLVENLSSAHRHSSRRSNGYHVIELAKCAYQFTKNEDNKDILLECKILPVLSDMLQSPPERSDEVSMALKIILSMSFNSACSSNIKEICGPELRSLRSNPQWKSNRDLEAIQYNTEEVYTTDGPFIPDDDNERGDLRDVPLPRQRSVKQNLQLGQSADLPPAPPPPSAPPPTGSSAAKPPPPQPPGASAAAVAQPQAPGSAGETAGHVMISYHQHSSGEFVRWICPQLKEQNFKVWVDFEQMQDSTLDCMAKAVEGSAAVLMCVCKGYKESNFCRMEAEYAVRRRKQLVPLLLEHKYKPDGWLGFIMGTQLYYNFSRNKEESFAKLVGYLKQSVLKSPDESIAPVTQPVQTATPPKPRPPPEPAYTKWTSEEVLNWLLENKLPSHLEPFKLEGRHLLFLLKMKSQAPEAFYRLLEKSLRLTLFHQLYDFVEALERL
ncbi:hypothetical protein BOX15_Mlig009876g2, partial [Macrostomum lignano]